MGLKRIHFGRLPGLVVICAVLLAGYLLTDTAAAPPPDAPLPDQIILEAKDNGRQVQLQDGQILVITLDSNPSTGYRWDPEGLDETVLRQKRTSQFTRESPLFGAPGKQILRFEALAAKQTALNLVYRRPWEKDLMSAQAAPAFSIQVQGVGPFAPDDAPSATPTATPESVAASAAESAGGSAQGLDAHFNWCEQGACPAVRDQGSCGSCWAFATAGALEPNIKIRDGLLKDLSEQYLLSCNTDGWDCGGGWWAHDYHEDKIPPGEPDAGAVYEADFPYDYDEYDQIPCDPPHTHREKITSWGYIGPDDDIASTSAIKQAIYDHGPVAVGVCSGSFGSYTGGVFTIDNTSSCGGGVDHAVVLTGWDDSQGIWYLRNSWGSGWGEGGYMRIKYGVSNVGYAATYIVYSSASPTSTPTSTHTPTPTLTPGTMLPRSYLPLVDKDGDTSPTPTPTPTTPPPQSVEMVQNGDFESGRTIWGESSSGGYHLIYEDEWPHWGHWSAWLGGYEDADDRLYQDISVPSWAQSARLQFYLYVQSEDVDWPFDFFHGELQTTSGSTLQSFGEADNTWDDSNWYLITQDWTDFSSHAGMQRRVFLQATNDESLNTDFYIDDVSFVAYSGSLGNVLGDAIADMEKKTPNNARPQMKPTSTALSAVTVAPSPLASSRRS